MKKLIAFMLVSLLITGLLSSCTSYKEGGTMSPEIVSQTNRVQEIFTELNSDKLSKRIPNTDASTKSMGLIADYFKQLSLKPYNNSDNTYYHYYYTPTYSVREESDVTLVIFTGATTSDLVFGRDFFIKNTTDKIKLELNVTSNANIKNPKKYIYMPIGKKPIADVTATNGKFAGYILQNDITSHPTNITNPKDTIIYVGGTVYDRLKASLKEKNSETYISLKAKPNIKKENLSNVVGKITGTSSTNAVVFSAPIDGVSPFLDSVSANDNSTGIATMLYIANHFSLLFKDISPPPFDVYFVGFNSSTSSFAGSKAFVNELYDTYNNTVNINLDNISGTMSISTGNTKGEKNSLLSSIKTYFDTVQVNTDDNVLSSADDLSFRKKGFSGATIGELESTSINTTALVSDTNLSYCSNIADLVAGFVLQKDKQVFKIK